MHHKNKTPKFWPTPCQVGALNASRSNVHVLQPAADSGSLETLSYSGDLSPALGGA